MNSPDIKDLTLEELKKAIAGIDEPPYRTIQIFFWLYKKGVRSFGEMSNLPKGLIDKLSRHFHISRLELERHLKSDDKTEKFLFRLSDGNFVETVLIYTADRETICLSSQVGCKYACSFCASGRIGFVRNLTAAEIINQILFLKHEFNHKITNCVFMGMGEPLDNYENTVKAILIMKNKGGLGMASRRITVSTCGVIPAIKKLAESGLEINLSLSLHATNNKLRDELVPINKRYGLEELIKACGHYVKKAGRFITLEYILIRGKNNFPEDADALASIAKRLNAKINLITYSAVPNFNYRPPNADEINLFIKTLVKRKLNVTLRKSKGRDIQAACGQLAGKKR